MHLVEIFKIVYRVNELQYMSIGGNFAVVKASFIERNINF